MIEKKDFQKCIIIGSCCAVAFIIMVIIGIVATSKNAKMNEPYYKNRTKLVKTIKTKEAEVDKLEKQVTELSKQKSLLENTLSKYKEELQVHGEFSSFEIDHSTVYCFYSQDQLYKGLDEYISSKYNLYWPDGILARKPKWVKLSTMPEDINRAMSTYNVPYCFYEKVTTGERSITYKFILYHLPSSSIGYRQTLEFVISIN